MATILSGVQLLPRETNRHPVGTGNGQAAEKPHPGSDTAQPQPTNGGTDPTTEPVLERMAGLLRTSGCPEAPKRTGPLDPSPPEGLCLDTVETGPDPLSEIARLWTARVGGPNGGKHKKRPVAGLLALKQRPEPDLLGKPGSGQLGTTVCYSASNEMNRRILIGTYGGVRGRELITPSYSICSNTIGGKW